MRIRADLDPDAKQCFEVLFSEFNLLVVSPTFCNDAFMCLGSRKIKVWDVTSQKLLQTFTGHASPITCLSTVSVGRLQQYA